MRNDQKSIHSESVLIYLSVFTVMVPTIGIKVLSISDILILISIFFFVLKGNMTNTLNRMNFIYIIGVFLLLFSYTLSSLFSDYTTTFDLLKLFSQYFFSFVVIKWLIGSLTEKTIDRLIITYIDGVVLSTLFVLVLTVSFPRFTYELFNLGFLASYRRFGAFVGPNMLAKIISSLLPLLFLLYLKKEINGIKFILYLFVIVVTLFKTASNGGFVSFLLAIFLIILFMPNKKNRKNIFFITLVSLFLIFLSIKLGLINTDLINSRIISVIQNDGVKNLGSYQIKKQLMLEGWNQVNKSPIIGLGPFSFREISSTSNTIHNSYILTWVEGGFFALIGLLLILGSILQTILKIPDTTVKNAYLIFFLIFTINLLTGTDYYQRYRIIPLLLVYESSILKSKKKRRINNNV